MSLDLDNLKCPGCGVEIELIDVDHKCVREQMGPNYLCAGACAVCGCILLIDEATFRVATEFDLLYLYENHREIYEHAAEQQKKWYEEHPR